MLYSPIKTLTYVARVLIRFKDNLLHPSIFYSQTKYLCLIMSILCLQRNFSKLVHHVDVVACGPPVRVTPCPSDRPPAVDPTARPTARLPVRPFVRPGAQHLRRNPPKNLPEQYIPGDALGQGIGVVSSRRCNPPKNLAVRNCSKPLHDELHVPGMILRKTE